MSGSEQLDHAWLLEQIRPPHDAVMLYGSYARGDATDESDIDVLQINSTHPGRYDVGRIAVVCYTKNQLAAMAERGSLYVLHLQLEGIVLRDANGDLRDVLRAYRQPSSYGRIIEKVQEATALLDVDRHLFEQHSLSLYRAALHLLRTVLYIRCVEMGRPTFAMREVADLLHDSSILDAYELGGNPDRINWEPFVKCREIVKRYVGELETNEYGDLASFAVARWEANPTAAAMAVSILSDNVEIDYAAIPLPAFLDE